MFTNDINCMPTLNSVPKWLTESLIHHFVTGSVRFGCQTSKSDIDICIPIMDTITKYVSDYKSSEYNNGIKFKENGIVINVIRLHPCDYVVWYKAAKIAEASGILSKVSRPLRHSLHESLCAIIKTSLHADNITSKNYLTFLI